MRQIYKGKITWVDIVSPDKEDIGYLQKNYHFHPLVLKEIEEPSQRNKAEIYDNYIFMVTHFPHWNPQKQTSFPLELDLIISSKALVTISCREVSEAHLELMEKIYQRDFEKEYLSDTIKLLHFIIEHYLDFAMRQIAHIQKKTDIIEELIFQKKQKEVIPLISLVKRDILNFRRVFRYLKEDLSSLVRRGPRLFGEETKIYFDDLLGDSLRVENVIENFHDTLEALENTNNSFIEQKINTLSLIYTIISFIAWPTLIIIGTYQMNVRFMPISGIPYDYWLVTGIAFLPSILIYFYLKKKNLL